MRHKRPTIFLTVVVVEDDPTFLSFWKRILEDLGITNYQTFSSAKEASKVLKKTSCKLLISDVILPATNGYELAKIACKKNPNCTILLTTAYSTNLAHFDLSNCRFHLLHKPYTDIIALRRFVKHLIYENDLIDDIPEESSTPNEDYPQITEWKL